MASSLHIAGIRKTFGSGAKAVEILKRIGPGPAEAEVAEGKTKTASDPLCVCFIGRPNVGKSSLINALLADDRLLTGAEPGLTREEHRAASRQAKEWHEAYFAGRTYRLSEAAQAMIAENYVGLPL